MIYRFRIILDTKEDVFRDIEINESSSLEELHNSIIKSFGFLGNEMASFYKTDNDWKQGDELPLNDFCPETPSMKNEKLSGPGNITNGLSISDVNDGNSIISGPIDISPRIHPVDQAIAKQRKNAKRNDKNLWRYTLILK